MGLYSNEETLLKRPTKAKVKADIHDLKMINVV